MSNPKETLNETPELSWQQQRAREVAREMGITLEGMEGYEEPQAPEEPTEEPEHRTASMRIGDDLAMRKSVEEFLKKEREEGRLPAEGEEEPEEPIDPKGIELEDPPAPTKETPPDPKGIELEDPEPKPVKLKAPKPVLEDRWEAPEPKEQPAPPAPAASDLDAEVAKLPKSLQRSIRLGRYAAEHEGYPKDFPERQLRYFKELAERASKGQQSGDDEFDEWVAANEVNFQPGDYEEFQEKLLRKEAIEEARKTFEQEQQELRKELSRLEARPKAEKALAGFGEVLTQTPVQEGVERIDNEVIDLWRKDPEQAKAHHPIEYDALEQAKAIGRHWIEHTLGLASDLHPGLANFVAGVEGNLEGKRRSQSDNRTYVPREDYRKLDEAGRRKHWTLGDNDILNLIAIEAHMDVHRQFQRLGAYKVQRKRQQPPEGDKSQGKETQKSEPAKMSSATPSPKGGVGGVTGGKSEPPRLQGLAEYVVSEGTASALGFRK